MKFYDNYNELKEDLPHIEKDSPVWRGEDGSYAVGHIFPIDVEEGDTEYREAGKVEDYID